MKMVRERNRKLEELEMLDQGQLPPLDMSKTNFRRIDLPNPNPDSGKQLISEYGLAEGKKPGAVFTV